MEWRLAYSEDSGIVGEIGKQADQSAITQTSVHITCVVGELISISSP